MPDKYGTSLFGKIACVRDGLCEWTTADTVLAWLLVVTVLGVLIILTGALGRR